MTTLSNLWVFKTSGKSLNVPMNLIPSYVFPRCSLLPKNPPILYPKYVLELILCAKVKAKSLSPMISICFRLRLLTLINLKTKITRALSIMVKIIPNRLKRNSIILEKSGWSITNKIDTNMIKAIISDLIISSAPENMEDLFLKGLYNPKK